MRPFFLTLLISLLSPGTMIAQSLVPAWAHAYRSSGNDATTAITLDAAGHMYATGSFGGTVDFDPGPDVVELSSAGSSDIYVTKMDTNGVLIWARAMGGTFSDGAAAMVVDDAGNVYTTGGFCGTADFDPGPGSFTMTAATTGQNDIFVSKLNANGDFVWAKGVVGGTWWDSGYGIDLDPAGSVVVTGRFYYQGGPRDFDPGPGTLFLTAGHEDIFVLKLDTDGDLLWAVNFGTGPQESRGYSIVVDDAGNNYITGYFRGTVDFDPGPDVFNMTSVGTWNIFYLKLSTNGELIWVKSLPISTTTYNYDGGYGRKMILDNVGNLIATGRFAGTVDFDPGAGVTALTSSGNYDAYVAKFDPDGQLIWATSGGGSGYDEGFGIAEDAMGDFHVVGTFESTASMVPGSTDLDLITEGGADIFVWTLSAIGQPMHAFSLGSQLGDKGYAVATGPTEALYLAGWSPGSVDLDPGPGTLNFPSAGGYDGFLVKLAPSSWTGLIEATADGENALALWPNPATDRAMLSLNPALVGRSGVVEVFDATGKRIRGEQIASLKMEQELELPSEWKEGLYLVMLRVEGIPLKSARVMIRR